MSLMADLNIQIMDELDRLCACGETIGPGRVITVAGVRTATGPMTLTMKLDETTIAEWRKLHHADEVTANKNTQAILRLVGLAVPLKFIRMLSPAEQNECDCYAVATINHKASTKPPRCLRNFALGVPHTPWRPEVKA